jgi:hypothetical protein
MGDGHLIAIHWIHLASIEDKREYEYNRLCMQYLIGVYFPNFPLSIIYHIGVTWILRWFTFADGGFIPRSKTNTIKFEVELLLKRFFLRVLRDYLIKHIIKVALFILLLTLLWTLITLLCSYWYIKCWY